MWPLGSVPLVSVFRTLDCNRHTCNVDTWSIFLVTTPPPLQGLTVASYQSTEHLQGGFIFECSCHVIIQTTGSKVHVRITLRKVSITDYGELHSQAFLFVPACGTNSCLVPGSTHSARFTRPFFMPFHSIFCHFFLTSESGTKLYKKGTEVHKNLTLK